MRHSNQFLLGLLLVAFVASSFAFQSAVPHFQQQRRSLESLAMSEDASPESPADGDEEATAKSDVVCPDCDMCDGSGRIAGGIGAILPFVPIKAYRPCPRFVENGGNYQRAGQALDEIAFGKERGD